MLHMQSRADTSSTSTSTSTLTFTLTFTICRFNDPTPHRAGFRQRQPTAHASVILGLDKGRLTVPCLGRLGVRTPAKTSRQTANGTWNRPICTMAAAPLHRKNRLVIGGRL